MARLPLAIAMSRMVTRSLVLLFVLAVLASGAWAQPTNIDVDEQRATPVPHRYIHGRLGDANFQIALPHNWNGKLLMGARGYSGDENSAG